MPRQRAERRRPATRRRSPPRPGGSPRCRPPPGTPGSPPTWPRCGPASSPWRSCHDRRRRAPAGAGRRTGPGRPARAAAWLRLAWLYLVSRRVPAALALLAGLGALLWAALHWHWNIAGGAAAQQVIPLTIETGAAAVIAVTTYGPFGEPERATGRWLPYLRLGAAVALTAAAFGALAAGATGGALPGGTLALLRNLAGMTGIGLLSAAVLGGAFGWTGPMAYLVVTEAVLAGRRDHAVDLAGPAAARPRRGALRRLVFAAGVVVITVRGARDSVRD